MDLPEQYPEQCPNCDAYWNVDVKSLKQELKESVEDFGSLSLKSLGLGSALVAAFGTTAAAVIPFTLYYFYKVKDMLDNESTVYEGFEPVSEREWKCETCYDVIDLTDH
jgi:hypothetical protein